MNGFDIAIAFVVLFSLWRGFSAGFIKSLFGLVGWFIALILASKLAGKVAPTFASWASSPDLQLALGFLAVVLVVITMLTLISSLINKMVDSLNLKIVDRFFGGILGAAKGVLAVLIFLSLTANFLVNFDFFRNSKLAMALMPYAPIAMQTSKDVIKRGMNEVLPNQKADIFANEQNGENGDGEMGNTQADNSQTAGSQTDNSQISETDMPSNQTFEDDKPSKPAQEEWQVVE